MIATQFPFPSIHACLITTLDQSGKCDFMVSYNWASDASHCLIIQDFGRYLSNLYTDSIRTTHVFDKISWFSGSWYNHGIFVIHVLDTIWILLSSCRILDRSHGASPITSFWNLVRLCCLIISLDVWENVEYKISSWW